MISDYNIIIPNIRSGGRCCVVVRECVCLRPNLHTHTHTRVFHNNRKQGAHAASVNHFFTMPMKLPSKKYSRVRYSNRTHGVRPIKKIYQIEKNTKSINR